MVTVSIASFAATAFVCAAVPTSAVTVRSRQGAAKFVMTEIRTIVMVIVQLIALRISLAVGTVMSAEPRHAITAKQTQTAVSMERPAVKCVVLCANIALALLVFVEME